MARELSSTTPLWIAALSVAVWVHMGLGGGGYVVGVIHEDHRALATLGLKARERVIETEQTFEIGGLDVQPKAAEEQPQEPPKPPPPPPEKKNKEEPVAKQEQPKKEEEKKKAEEKKVVVVQKKDEEKKVLAQPLKDNRIAVRQHVKANQADNPNAHFVGDEANHVDEETVATQTSHDQDDPNPTPGGNHPGADPRVGDSSQTKIAESEEHAGEKNRAPGEKGTEFDVQKEPMPLRPMGPVAMVAPPSPVPPVSGGDGRTPQAPTPAPQPQLMPGQAAPSGADVQDAPNGEWTFSPTRPGAPTGVAQMPGPGQSNPTNNPNSPQSPTQWLGLGGHPGPGQVNLNLNQQGIVAVVGQDQLRKEREADGERRKSEHRGSWIASNFERWRSAIENYVSSVKPGNQTALNTAAVPFATYLNGMHNRIHPIFADSFLSSLDNLPASHPMNDPKMFTRLEIVLSRDGHLVKMGIVKTSGVTAFDIAALDSVQRASPFGSAPTAIVSPDGRVYLHWEFHRDEVYACSTMNARPFLLNVPAKEPNENAPPGPSTPQPPATPQERGAPTPVNSRDIREGLLLLPPKDPSAT